MSKKIRDFIFILFVIIYIVTATVTCLFASGYKFNVAWPLQFNRLLIKTGTLSIASSPKNAFIFLNDKQQNNKESISNGSWLMSGEEFFANKKIYNINDESIADLLPEHNETALSWKYDNDNNSIYYKTNSNSIYRLENDFKTSTNILSERSFLDYKQEGDSIFIVSEQNNRKYLQEFDISTQQELKMMELPTLGNYLFYSGNKNGHITLYDKQNSSLYLIDKNDWQKSFNIGQVKDWQFIDKNRIIYHNGWEITLLNTQDGTSYLLARVSDLIQKITWHSEENYFIFSTIGSIQAGDLQGNMLTTLFKTQEIGDIALDSKKNILYFYANIGQQAGIYKLMLK